MINWKAPEGAFIKVFFKVVLTISEYTFGEWLQPFYRYLIVSDPNTGYLKENLL